MEIEAKKSFIINFIYAIVVAAIVYAVYKFLLVYLLPFLIGLLLTYLLQKPSRIISDKIKLKQGTVSAVMVFISYLLVVAVICAAFGAVFFNIDKIAGTLKNVVAYVSNLFDRLYRHYDSLISRLPNEAVSTLSGITAGINEWANEALNDTISSAAAGIIKKLPTLAVSSIVTVVASCYIAKDYNFVRDFILSVIPRSKRRIVFAVKRIITVNLFKIIRGYFTLSLITFGELAVGFFVLGIDKPLRYAILIAIVDVLPVLGAGIVLVPWGIICVLDGNVLSGTALLILYVVILLVRNFLEPKIVGAQVGIPPLVSLILIFCGLKLFGVIGMFFSLLTLIVIVNLYKEKIIEL